MPQPQPGPLNRITDVPGLTVGHAGSAVGLKSGVTVVVPEGPGAAAAGMTVGVAVAGGAPGTRETDVLRPDSTVPGVHAVVLAGGSAFGLAAADGVAAALATDGRGVQLVGHTVPVVPAAVLFDLDNGGEKQWDVNPYPALGAAAYAARRRDFELGSVGAGTGATVAGLKGGLGSASAVLPGSGVTVGAVVAVNAVGQATVGSGPHFWAAPFEHRAEFGGLGVGSAVAPSVATKMAGPELTGGGQPQPGRSTTLAVVATDARLSKAEATRLAVAAHDGLARAIVPAHTPLDGDLVFACSTGAHPRPIDPVEWAVLGHVAATCLARAIARAVYEAESAPGDLVPPWRTAFGSATKTWAPGPG